MLIDSHCHLDYPALLKDREGVLARARAAGIGRMVNISTTMQDFIAVRATAEEVPEVFCTVGVHPHHVHDEGENPSLDKLKELATHSKVVGVGETGLDFYYNKAPREIQEESFRRHIRVSQDKDLPLIIHSREAEEDTVRILREEGANHERQPKGVMHCFSSKRILAEQALELGFYISLSGILTFKKSEELRAIARDVPLDRLLVETDAPYLAPEPLRGKVCEPSFVVNTARVLAELKGVSFEVIAAQTTKNFFQLFSKVTPLS